MLEWFDEGTVLASLRVLGLGMAGILATSALFMLLIVALRRAFPPPREPEELGRSERSNEL